MQWVQCVVVAAVENVVTDPLTGARRQVLIIGHSTPN